MYGPYAKAGMCGGKVFFAGPDNTYIETTHFKQVPTGEEINSSQPMEIICLDCNERFGIFNSIGPEGFPKVEREFYVTSKLAPFLFEGKYLTAERLKNLLIASIETGNPISWC